MEPPLASVTVEAELTPDTRSACGNWRAALDLQMNPAPGWPQHHLSPWRVRVRGPYPLSCGAQTWPVLWPGVNGDDFAARLLTQTWRQLGGELDGQVRSGAWPADAGIWQSWTSEPLAEVVRDINKFSNNVMARQLFLTLGGAEATARTVRAIAAGHTLDTRAILAHFGDAPLISVRPSPENPDWGGPATILNIGFNAARHARLAETHGQAAADALYLRFVQGYAIHVARLDPDMFDDIKPGPDALRDALDPRADK